MYNDKNGKDAVEGIKFSRSTNESRITEGLMIKSSSTGKISTNNIGTN